MPTAIEKFYQRKRGDFSQIKADKIPDGILQEKLAQEVLGRQILKKHSPGFFVKLLDILDRPGNATRALLVGKLGGLKGLIPFAQVIEDLTGINVALDPDERVRGTEVIEKFFGKQKQVKGKIDMVDVLGLIVEIVADPLWLIGGAGLTKLGKAQKLIGSGKNLAVAQQAVAAVKAGKSISPTVSKGLSKAIKTVIEAGQQPGLAKGWAAQAAKGQRAALKLGLPGKRIPVFKGSAAFWNRLDKISTAWKKSLVGSKFFPATRRVSSENAKLHELFTTYARDLPDFHKREAMERFSQLQIKLGKLFNTKSFDEADALMTRFVESEFAPEAVRRRIAAVTAERVARAKPRIKTTVREATALKGKIATKQKELQAVLAKDIPTPQLRPIPKKAEIGFVPKVKGFGAAKRLKPKVVSPKQVVSPQDIASRDWAQLRGIDVKEIKQVLAHRSAQAYENQIAKLKTAIDRLRKTNTPAARAQIRRAETKINSLLKDQVINGIKRINRTAILRHQRAVAKESARVSRSQALKTGGIRTLEARKGIVTRRVARLKKTALSQDIKAIRDAQKAGVFHKAEAARLIKQVPEAAQPEFRRLAQEFGPDVNRKLLEAEQALGIKVGEIDDLIGYVSRAGALTDDARRFLQDTKIQERFLLRARKISPRLAAQKGRGGTGSLTRGQVNDLFKGLGFKGDDVFDPSFARAQFTRTASSLQSRGVVDFLQQSVDEFAKPAGSIPDSFPLTEFMERTGLKFDRLGTQGRVLPKEVAEAMLQMRDVILRPEALSTAYSDVTRYLKGAFTIPFPAFHARNHFSNYVLNWIGGVKNPRSYLMSIQLQKAAAATTRLAKRQNIPFAQAARQVQWPTVQTARGAVDGASFWRTMEMNGILHKSPGMMDIIEVPGAVGLEPLAKTRLGRHIKGQGPGWAAMRKAGLVVEDHARIAHFVEKSAAGFDPTTAARSVKKHLFDYGDLSDFEKRIFRDRVAFFYTFARKNLALQTDTLLTQPAKQAVFSHLAGGTPVLQGEARNYPDWWNERLTVPLPFRDKQGLRQVITGAGLPIEEAFGPLAGPGVGAVQRGRRILSRGFSRLNPIILRPIEFATGRNMFFDQPIRDYGRFAAQTLPTARLTGTIRNIREGAAPLPSRLLGAATGIKYRPLEPLRQEAFQRRNVARKFLEGRAPQFKRFFKPKDTEVDSKIDLALQMQR